MCTPATNNCAKREGHLSGVRLERPSSTAPHAGATVKDLRGEILLTPAEVDYIRQHHQVSDLTRARLRNLEQALIRKAEEQE